MPLPEPQDPSDGGDEGSGNPEPQPKPEEPQDGPKGDSPGEGSGSGAGTDLEGTEPVSHERPELAQTGAESLTAPAGVATGALLIGAGAMLAVRRARRIPQA